MQKNPEFTRPGILWAKVALCHTRSALIGSRLCWLSTLLRCSPGWRAPSFFLRLSRSGPNCHEPAPHQSVGNLRPIGVCLTRLVRFVRVTPRSVAPPACPIHLARARKCRLCAKRAEKKGFWSLSARLCYVLRSFRDQLFPYFNGQSF